MPAKKSGIASAVTIVLFLLFFSLSLNNVFAADNSSNFQNKSPWFVAWYQEKVSAAKQSVSDATQSMGQWWQNFISGSVNNRTAPPANQQQPLNQYPAITMPSGQQSQNQSGGSQQGGSEDGNGTPGSPYKLEPNQFKKMCGQNTYVLYWRKGGQKGKDMAQPAGGAGAGKDQGARDYWQLPTCKELSKCHCCCNTCTFPQGQICPAGWCFSKKTICDDKEECTDKCSNKCDEKCKKGCEDYKEPTHDKAFNRDCKCNVEGCPESKSENCEIMIIDTGKTDVEYTKKDGDKEQYFKAVGLAKFKNGNGSDDPKSKIIAQPNDKASQGYVKKLKDEKGKCCKCYQDGPPIQ